MKNTMKTIPRHIMIKLVTNTDRKNAKSARGNKHTSFREKNNNFEMWHLNRNSGRQKIIECYVVQRN